MIPARFFLFTLFLLTPVLPGREVIDLQGTWQIQKTGGKWQKIIVPSTWEGVLGENFDKSAWYRKKFMVPLRAGKGRVLLRFHGAATAARILVNGQEVGQHIGAWTTFTLDVTNVVEPGKEALLKVHLDELPGHNTQGFLPIIAPHFGGIWQKVELLLTGPAWLDDRNIRITAIPLSTNPEQGKGKLHIAIPLGGRVPKGSRIHYQLRPATPNSSPITQTKTLATGNLATFEWQGPVNYWGINQPNLYHLETELFDSSGDLLDRQVINLGFRSLVADGSRLLLNGKPIIVRGILTWGCSQPLLAPIPQPAKFRQRLRYFRSCGFNLIKFCLWLPPSIYLDIADQEGMLTWVEYPTWHPKIDQEHRAELLREYREFSAHDCTHPSVVLRSITCETGPSADLKILTEIYNLLKQRSPGTLVEDDSSWIGWNRVHDFWDDHSYGNNRTWRAKLKSLHQHRLKHGIKPLLLGEAVSADTWPNSQQLQKSCHAGSPWWAPRWFTDQVAFEKLLAERYDQPGFCAVADLYSFSMVYAHAMRRWQLETFRALMPHSGCVVSVVMDVKLCAMGLLDYYGQPKWPITDWDWFGPRMRALLAPGDCRGFPAGKDTRAKVVFCTPAGIEAEKEISIFPGPTRYPTPFTIKAPGKGPHRGWQAWALPPSASPPKGLAVYGETEKGPSRKLFPTARLIATGSPPDKTPIVVTQFLDSTLLDYVKNGGRLLHFVSQKPNSFRTEGTWFLRGTVWAPPTAVGISRRIPRQLLAELQLYELGGNQVMRGERLWQETEPLLMFIETHDLKRVRPNLLLFQTGIGKGRLLVSALRHHGGETENHAGMWLAHELANTLLHGPAPTRSLSPTALEALTTAVDAQVIKIQTPWRFRRDPEAQGHQNGWQQLTHDDSQWLKITGRSSAESKAWHGYDGYGWYRQWITIPAAWQGRQIRLVCESVDDMYTLYVNGKKAGGHGVKDKSVTSYLRRTWVDITPHIMTTKKNLFALMVYDWYGGAGLNGEVWLTTGPVEKELDFLKH